MSALMDLWYSGFFVHRCSGTTHSSFMSSVKNLDETQISILNSTVKNRTYGSLSIVFNGQNPSKSRGQKQHKNVLKNQFISIFFNLSLCYFFLYVYFPHAYVFLILSMFIPCLSHIHSSLFIFLSVIRVYVIYLYFINVYFIFILLNVSFFLN